MGSFEYSVRILAAPELVWRVYSDPTRIPEWQTGMPRIEDVQGDRGAPGSSYVSRRGRLAARTWVVAADAPRELVTRTDAYFGLRLEVISRLDGRSDGTLLQLHVRTLWDRRFSPLAKVVELAILNASQARKELDSLKALVESETPR